MNYLARAIFRWVLRHFLNLLLIFAVLLLGRWGWAEWHALQAVRAEQAWLGDAHAGASTQVSTLVQSVTQRMALAQSASLDALERQIVQVSGTIEQKQQQKRSSNALGKVLSGQSVIQSQVDAMLLDVEIALLAQEQAHLVALKSRLLNLQSVESGRVELERLRRIHQAVYAQWQSTRLQKEVLEQQHPWKCWFGVGSPEFSSCLQLQRQLDQYLAENRKAAANYAHQLEAMKNRKAVGATEAFAVRSSEIDALTQPVRTRLAELAAQRSNNYFEKWLPPIRELAPTAFLILLGLIVTPLAIKALFYFVLAPLAARRPPTCLLPETSGALTLQTGRSAVSCPVLLTAENELLVHAEFLQSSADQGGKQTVWLLNWSYPWTSLASRMVALTRIRTPTAASYVVSATQDPLSEIGMLTLPRGAALVIQPHNLVGVVQPRGEPVRMTSHWRLLSLHAWLTLQLRYLAFHGPGQLLVQGCRGVRIEKADAGRSINQAATIGFSANLLYSTRRCETFVAYLLGKQELMNDTFSGETGSYVYEEMPHWGKKTGLTGRGLEGLSDSVLKIFGI